MKESNLQLKISCSAIRGSCCWSILCSKSRVLPVRGFTLIFAVLVSGLLLAIGVAIASIAVRELSLSSTARESQFAFYAADSGADCALYWDIQENVFAAPESTGGDPAQSPFINCAGWNGSALPQGSDPVTSFFEIDYGAACARVYVQKGSDGGTVIESNGINDSCSNLGSAGKLNRVNRSLRVSY